MSPTGQPKPGTLGAVIREARERQGLSLRQLAHLVGADASAVIRWEQNTRTPKPAAISALARALELSSIELMDLAGIDYSLDPLSLPAMLRSEYDLPPEAIEQVQRYVARMARKHNKTSSSSNKRGGTDEQHQHNEE